VIVGREIRRVPADWEHPRYTEADVTASDWRRVGQYRPLYDEDYHAAAARWIAELVAWQAGTHPDWREDSSCRYYWEWAGGPPDEEMYRARAWTPEEAMHFQVYETVSEGTPVGPVLPSAEAVEEWLVGQGHSRAAARDFVAGGRAPSFVTRVEDGVLLEAAAGVDALDLMHRD
jgi:hypothetical protein